MFVLPLRRLCAISLLALALALPRGAAEAETLVGNNVDNRVLVGFAVADEAMQPFLPDGWTPTAFPGGPFAGANLLLVAIDRLVQLDAEGAPSALANSRYIAVVGLGKETDGEAVRLYVYRIYASDPAPDPYGNSVEADVARITASEGPANGARMRRESWRASPAEGGTLEFTLEFSSGARGWAPGEAKPYSNTQPDFHRIYRFEQLVDLVMSKGAGKPLEGSFTLSSDVAELAEVFDGSEEVIGILDVPVYVRSVYLP